MTGRGYPFPGRDLHNVFPSTSKLLPLENRRLSGERNRDKKKPLRLFHKQDVPIMSLFNSGNKKQFSLSDLNFSKLFRIKLNYSFRKF